MNESIAETPSLAREGILSRLFPRRIDNTYSGSKIALWIFGLILALRITQSLFIIVNGYSTVQSADDVPLETYPAAAAQTIVAMFALSSVNRLIIVLICVVVLVRYRSAVPMMFLVLGLSYLGGQLVLQFIPIVRVGAPPGVVVNLSIFGLTIVGFVLSLWRRRSVAGA